MSSIISLTWPELRRKPCPGCGKKGLAFADHPDAFGYKDRTRVRCRYCKGTFKKKQQQEKKR